MDKGDLYCQICGVSFRIGRIRTVDEPPSAAWDGPRSDYLVGSVMSPHYSNSNCGTGCSVTVRKFRRSAESMKIAGYADPPDTIDAGVSPDGSSESFVAVRPDPIPEDRIDRRFRGIGKTHYLEHIAGPNCVLLDQRAGKGGYIGHRISVQEMEGCDKVQCLLRKPVTPWIPEGTDEEYEKTGDYFVTGFAVTHGMVEAHPRLIFLPDRHNDQYVRAGNYFPTHELVNGIPFHAACLEVFKRACLHRYGDFRFDALENWWRMEGTRRTFTEFPRHPAVIRGMGNKESTWCHITGDEWLVANPCRIPGLESLLLSTQNLNDTAHPNLIITTESADSFSRFPLEVRVMIATMLDAEDIGALQIASKSFWRLPQSIYRRIVIHDRPWIWEMWSHLDYSWWISKEARSIWDTIRHCVQLQLEKEETKNETINVTGMFQAAREYAIDTIRECRPSPAMRLDADNTNWFHLFQQTALGMKRGELKGLKNRRRIWEDCQEILNRAEQIEKERNVE